MNIIGMIPARMASTRFPGKPLAKINSIPMIGHVYYRCKMCALLTDVYVATCDREVFDYIESIGGKAVMTADTHERASDRCAEGMLKIEQKTGKPTDILAMIQGDEPMVYPEMITEALQPMIDDPNVMITNLLGQIASQEEFEDPNQVKVVTDLAGNALYFSREPIPSRKKYSAQVPMFKQVPIIPFRRDFLIEYNNMSQTPLEIIESVDMMRIVENGIKIRMIKTKYETHAVDTAADLHHVEELMKEDSLVRLYERA
ncbi:MAG: 3-deoxy-manno-octulosonate cytidylyltransferase [Deltaproteobacteria bacterium]|uniref:3-deoxy-manno-octulosonate cytidylyltransferase n=1 Tax=Hydrosulfovibrio ferrireducens TaxID=2934181 RepID=UPI0011FDE8D4|nr:MAG: 3-deoxy-manno-octulosonate cytidylyltransferase [Deltaproteobacteria bacterium]